MTIEVKAPGRATSDSDSEVDMLKLDDSLVSSSGPLSGYNSSRARRRLDSARRRQLQPGPGPSGPRPCNNASWASHGPNPAVTVPAWRRGLGRRRLGAGRPGSGANGVRPGPRAWPWPQACPMTADSELWCPPAAAATRTQHQA